MRNFESQFSAHLTGVRILRELSIDSSHDEILNKVSDSID